MGTRQLYTLAVGPTGLPPGAGAGHAQRHQGMPTTPEAARQGGGAHEPNPPTYLFYDAVALLSPATQDSSAQVSWAEEALRSGHLAGTNLV